MNANLGVAASVMLLAVQLGASAPVVRAGPAPETDACAVRPEYHRLDFWLGDWRVYVGTQLDGENHIAPILAGCAIEEDWLDANGHRGKGWFYVDKPSGRLKQIFLTDHAQAWGGVKEKSEREDVPAGSVGFEGTLVSASGQTILDRTTLTPAADGTIRQVIELSRDEGKTWRVAYDAIYRRAPAHAAVTGPAAPHRPAPLR
jgi:hypothetical protein